MFYRQEKTLSLYLYKGEILRAKRYISQFIDSTYVSGNLIEIGGYKPDFIKGYEVEWYDISLEAGRNAKGTMHLNYLADKFKIILKTTPLMQAQLTEFYSHIPREAIIVRFFNPFTGTYKNIKCYRGDRKVSMLFDFNGVGKLYDEVDQSFIEL